MANNKIQGITVEIGGDSTPLSKAIDSANQKSRLLQQELRGVNTLMKGDPNSAVLLSQKQEILNKSVEETRAKLQMLKSKQEEVTQAFQKNEITEEQYRNFQREIEKTEQDLVNLRTKQLECASVKFDNAINSTKKFGETLTGIGNKLKVVSTAAAGLIAVSVKNASEYETAVAKVSTLTDKQVLSNENLSKGILQISNDLGKANTDIAEAAYQSLSASVDTGNALEFTANAAKLAKAGFTETATAVDVLTTIENAYNISADKTNTLSDMLVNTQNKGKTTVGQLAETMGRVIPTAETLNVSIGQLCTGYSEMTKRGINTANATTYMNSLFDEFGKSSTDLYAITEKVAGKSFKDLMKEGKSLGDVIQMLADYAEKNNENFNDFFGKSNSRKAALSILKVGADGFNESLRDMENCTGTVDQALEDLQTPTAKAKKSINQLKNTSVEFGSQVLSDVSPIIDDFGDKIKDLSEWWSGLNDSQKESTVKIAGIVAVGAPALILLGKATTGIATLTSNLKTAIISIMAKTTATEADTVATTTATVATGALSVAMKALPLLAIAGLVVTVASELVNLCSATDDTANSTEKLTKFEKELNDTFEKQKTAYNEAKIAAQEKAEAQSAEIDYTLTLVQELEDIIDKNGKIKKGYESREKFILNNLNNALGTEYTSVSEILNKNNEITESIKKQIELKKAQLLLEAHKEEYESAKKSIENSSIKAANDAVELARTTKEYEKAKKAYEEYAKKLEESAVSTGRTITLSETKKREELYKTAEKMKKAKETAEKTYKESASTAKKQSETIQKYERASTLVIAGESKKAIKALENWGSGFKTVESLAGKSTKEQKKELREQVIAYEVHYRTLKAQYDANKDNLSKSERAAAKKSIENAKKMAKRARDEYIEVGAGMLDGIDVGEKKGESKICGTLLSVVKSAVKTAKEYLGIKSPSRLFRDEIGVNISSGIAAGIKKETDNVSNSLETQLLTMRSKARKIMNVFSNDVPDEYYSTNLGANFHTAVEHTFSNLETQSTAQTVETLSSDVAKIGKQLDQLIDKAQKNIVIDGKALVGATVSETDKQLGNRQEFIGRGLPT